MRATRRCWPIPTSEAVYISLPNHLHALWTIRCAEAGKHILCEKPLATNHAEAMTAVEAARYHDVFLMEAFMYRCHPADGEPGRADPQPGHRRCAGDPGPL